MHLFARNSRYSMITATDIRMLDTMNRLYEVCFTIAYFYIVNSFPASAETTAQPTFNCSKSTMKTLKQCVKYVYIQQ